MSVRHLPGWSGHQSIITTKHVSLSHPSHYGATDVSFINFLPCVTHSVAVRVREWERKMKRKEMKGKQKISGL